MRTTVWKTAKLIVQVTHFDQLCINFIVKLLDWCTKEVSPNPTKAHSYQLQGTLSLTMCVLLKYTIWSSQ